MSDLNICIENCRNLTIIMFTNRHLISPPKWHVKQMCEEYNIPWHEFYLLNINEAIKNIHNVYGLSYEKMNDYFTREILKEL